MRRGRPSTHIKAKWVTFTQNNVETFYELDDKGKIILDNRKIVPHHKNTINIPVVAAVDKKEDNSCDSDIADSPIPLKNIKEEKKNIVLPSLIPSAHYQNLILPTTSSIYMKPMIINILPIHNDDQSSAESTPKATFVHPLSLF